MTSHSVSDVRFLLSVVSIIMMMAPHHENVDALPLSATASTEDTMTAAFSREQWALKESSPSWSIKKAREASSDGSVISSWAEDQETKGKSTVSRRQRRLLPDGARIKLTSSTLPNVTCPCTDESLCVTPQGAKRVEYFGFGDGGWESFDWSKITTVAWAQGDIICSAHRVGARVIAGTPDLIFSSSKKRRAEWIKQLIISLKSNFLDGVTFDFEEPLDARTPQSPDYLQSSLYVLLVKETTAALHTAIPGSQVSVCVAWNPDGVDGRYYDYAGLADASDYLYVMAYDVRSQVFDEQCIASANSPIGAAQSGITRYLSLGIPASKLILGTPWYGYVYPCLKGGVEPGDTCEIERVPFRGANCSDAAGYQLDYCDIMNLFDQGICPGNELPPCEVVGGMMWDEATSSPFFNFKSGPLGKASQVWFDDAKSSALKYAMAARFELGGVGPYRWDDLDPTGKRTGNPHAPGQATAMWKSLDVFQNNTS